MADSLNSIRKKQGDFQFLSIDTRSNGTALKEGMLQDGRNIRLELQSLETRKGLKQFFSDTIKGIVLPVAGSSIIASGVRVKRDGTEEIVIVVEDGLFLYDMNSGSPLSSKYNFPTGRKAIAGQTQVLQAVNNIYILRGESELFREGVSKHVNIGEGIYDVVVTTNLGHTVTVGTEVILESEHEEMSGSFVVKSVQSSNQFTVSSNFNSNHLSDHPVLMCKGRAPLIFNGSSVTVTRQGRIDGSINGNSQHCDFPPTSNGIYFRNRLYLKYSRDEIAVSYYLPNETGDWEFDLSIQAFQINAGDEQEIVGFYPWSGNKVLVLKTNSIYEAVISDNTTSPEIVLKDTTIKALTNDIGCVAERSMGNVSGSVFFLSGAGVFALEPQIDVQLIANTFPLSQNIQKYVELIDVNNSHKAVGQIFAGRYYLSVPIVLDGVSRISVFVYNLNNKNWESVDTYPIGFHIDNILVARFGSQRKLFFLDNKNGLFLAEELDVDQFGKTTGAKTLVQWLPFYLNEYEFAYSNIQMYAKTRQLDFGTLQQKRFVSCEFYANYGLDGAIKVTANTINPDATYMADISTASFGAELTRAFPLRKKGTSIEYELTSLQGRPSIYSITTEATAEGRDLRSEK
jgi:hypothetical protein